MSVEFEALKSATEQLLTAYKALKLQVSNPPAQDPAPADLASLTTEITSVLNTPA